MAKTKRKKKGESTGKSKQQSSYLKFRARWRHVLLIEQRIRSGRAPNTKTLADELEVSRRTVMRDIDFLRYDLGAPIEYDANKGGYVYTESNWDMPSVRISEGELFALMIAEKALEAYAGTPWVENLQRIFNRIINSLPDRIEIAPQSLLTRVDFGMNAPAIVEPEILKTIGTAIKKNQTLAMEYFVLGRGEVREYVINPYVLRQMRGAWYLAAKDCRTGHVPLFNISRIRKVQPTGSTFDYEASEFDPDKYFQATFSVLASSKRYKIVIEFSGNAVYLIRERQWHESQNLKELSGGRLRFEVTVSHLYDILPWILSWGSQAKVIAPKELIDLISEEAQKTAEQYMQK